LAEGFDVGVVGTGYVGLVTGACLAHLGHKVTCVDKDEDRVRGLEGGRVPFYEPGLQEFVARSARSGRLSFVGLEGRRRWCAGRTSPL
jgi:UDPglucose 6-dehydrogenase